VSIALRGKNQIAQNCFWGMTVFELMLVVNTAGWTDTRISLIELSCKQQSGRTDGRMDNLIDG